MQYIFANKRRKNSEIVVLFIYILNIKELYKMKTIVKGRKVPPTSYVGTQFELIDKTEHKRGGR